MDGLTSNRLDVAITTLVSEQPAYESRPFCNEDILLIAPKPFTIRDLRSKGVVVYSNIARYWNDLVRRYDLSGAPCTMVNSFNGAIELVRRDAGIGLVPGSRKALAKKFHTRIASVGARDEIFVSFRKEEANGGLVSAFVKSLLEQGLQSSTACRRRDWYIPRPMRCF